MTPAPTLLGTITAFAFSWGGSAAMLESVLTFVGAALTCFIITPVVLLLAQRAGLTDKPDSHRKLHGRPIPLGGGVAVFLSFSIATIIACSVGFAAGRLPAAGIGFVSLLASALVIVVTGVLDDRFSLRGRHKLAGQFLAVAIVVGSGLVVKEVKIFDAILPLGALAIPFTLFWLVGAINAINLIDGIDGLATSVGAILSAAIGLMALMVEAHLEAMMAFALAGSLVGFLRFNFPPAKMFLGDAGSMLIGLIVGVLAIRCSLKGPATVALAAPLAIWAIPIFDSAAAILRRKLTGRSIYTTDRAHLHHCLMTRFGSNRVTLSAIGICCALTSAGALVSVWLHNDILAAASTAAVLGILVIFRLFGHVEAELLSSKLKATGVSLFLPGRKLGDSATKGASIRMQGTRQWDLLWTTLTESTDKLGLHSLCLDVNLPAVQEGFHASWKRSLKSEPDRVWRTELPLIIADRILGRLIVTGLHDGRPVCELLERLLELIEPFESQLFELTAIDRPVPGAPHVAFRGVDLPTAAAPPKQQSGVLTP